jgi:hypothetical protein
VSTQTQIIKTKEVWRDAKGHFVMAPKPVQVTKPEPKEQTDATPALILLGGTAAVMAVVYWQTTLTLVGLALVVYAIRWHGKRPKIVINNYGGV